MGQKKWNVERKVKRKLCAVFEMSVSHNMYARVRNIHWWYDERKRKVTYSARFISDLRGFSSCSAKFSNIWVMWNASRNCLQNMWQSYYLTTHAVSQTWNQDWILDWNVSAMLQSFPWQRLNSGQSTSTGGLCQSTDYDCTVHRHCLPCRAFFCLLPYLVTKLLRHTWSQCCFRIYW